MRVSAAGCSNGLKEALRIRSGIHVTSGNTASPLLWVVTDGVGNIQQLSSATAAMLGIGPDCRQYNLLLFLPQHQRAAILDMEIALTGWASLRRAVLNPLAQRPVAVRYLVSRQLGRNHVWLHWSFDPVWALAAISWNEQRGA